jgi:hypothetical protein
LCYPVPGNLKFETIKFGHESCKNTDPRKTVLEITSGDCILHTHPLVREGKPITTNPQLSKENYKEKGNKNGHGSQIVA